MDRRHFLAAGATGLLLPGCMTRPAAALPQTLAWRKLETAPYKGKQDDIAFGSARIGCYGNGEGRIFRTLDGGDSWAEVWRKPGTFVRALGFIDEREGVMGNVGVGSFPNVTDTTPLYRTSDGGVTWQPSNAFEGPVPDGICAIEIVRSAFIDRGERAERTIVHAAGRVGGPAFYLRSSDGGRSWTSRDLGALVSAIYDVKFTSPRTGFLAASAGADLAQSRGVILRSEDGGDSWHEVYRSKRNVETVWKLHFPTTSAGYGTVQSYDPDPANVQRFVAATADGGRSWHEVPLVADAKWRSFGIGFATPRLGWVGGNLGGLETRDGGASWAPVEIGKAVNKIRFVGTGAERRVFAIGSEIHRLDLGNAGK
jgi:photosystem II stability/assembly factor-like uncharacterized protein